jgi:hypothetical protein
VGRRRRGLAPGGRVRACRWRPDHLDNPHIDEPAPGKGASMLDTNLTELFADHAALNRVVETIALDQGVDFMQALEQLHQGVD